MQATLSTPVLGHVLLAVQGSHKWGNLGAQTALSSSVVVVSGPGTFTHKVPVSQGVPVEQGVMHCLPAAVSRHAE